MQNGCNFSVDGSNSKTSHIFNVFNYTSFNIVIPQNECGSADPALDYPDNPMANPLMVDNSLGSIGKGDLVAVGNRVAEIWALNASNFSPPARKLCRSRHETFEASCDAFNASIRPRSSIDYPSCFDSNDQPSSYTDISSPLKS